MAKKKSVPNYNPHPPVSKKQPAIDSLLDKMIDGKEYSSIIGLNNVKIDLGQEYLRIINEISTIRGRPLICYIANVINPQITQSISIDNADGTPFLEMLNNVPFKSKGIDILLVTPGGSAETVSFFVNQIRAKFDNVAFILPHMAMSAGTIFCMSGDELIMDEAAFFGPIDPQVPSKNGRYVPAQSIITLISDIQKRGKEQLDKGLQPDWTDVEILRNLDAKEIGTAINASKFSTDLVTEYLEKYKFKQWIKHHDETPVTPKEKHERAEKIAEDLCNHSLWLSHSNRITRDMAWETCKLKISHPEETPGLARAIKRFWALTCFALEHTTATKIFASSNYMLFRNEVIKK